MCKSLETEAGGAEHTCNPSTGEDSKLEARVGYKARGYLKNKKES